ncbi:PQQ-like beta-propeller repeat protein [Candidatus Sumerlaeota bacterium]|nr:PQQ-like beta-propeller repeat protein [Candidatus Sumerlaeota bacterium]
MSHSKLRMAILSSVFMLGVEMLPAADWPQWRGPDRLGNWNEEGILDKFPAGGLKVEWRKPIGSGYSGPVVAGGRIFAMDWRAKPDSKRIEGTERMICLDEKTGETIWTREWPVDYSSQMQSYATGPRATPTVDGERVYAVGAAGNILCLNVKTGEIIWMRDCVKEFGLNMPTWGTASSPLIDDSKVICVTGAEPVGKIMAFDKMTGKEIWRSLPSDSEIGYSQPMIFEAGGKRQLIYWHPKGVASLDPESGKPYWEQPFNAPSGMSIATPAMSGPYLFVSNFYGGSLMMELESASPAEMVLWQIKGKSEMPGKTESLHAVLSTPIILGDYIYGFCSYGELRCLNAKSGERIWENKSVTRQGRWGSGFIVRNGDRWFINNDQGELIIGRFTPESFIEIDRTLLINPDTSSGFGPRKLYDSTVNWVHPAYANKHVVTRNDSEILRAALGKE